MSEAGGPATQSGIVFQNSIAALHMGRMIDARPRRASDSPVSVRVEARGPVDDVVVVYRDGRRVYVQAKERVAENSVEWRALWASACKCHSDGNFGPTDTIVFAIGRPTAGQRALRGAAERARHSADPADWIAGLTMPQRGAVKATRLLLSGTHQTDADALALFRTLAIDIVTTEAIEEDRVPDWMPASKNADPRTVFDVLRGLAQRYAGARRTWTREDILAELTKVGISVEGLLTGLPKYRDAVRAQFARVSVPGTQLQGPIADAFFWPTLRENSPRAPEARDPELHLEIGVRFEPQSFPEAKGDRVVLASGAGGGKSTLLRVIAHRLADSEFVPVVLPLAEVASRGTSVVEAITAYIAAKYTVEVPWADHAADGSLVGLFDGLEELSPPERTSVLTRLEAFSAEFPTAPWMLATRDASAFSAPIQVRHVQLQPLRSEDVRPFCEGWLGRERESFVTRICSSVERSADLTRMARVPLLLALLIDRLLQGPDSALPVRRSDLLAHYVRLLLKPQLHKPGVDIEQRGLQSSAEHLAYAILCRARQRIHVAGATDVLGSDGMLDRLRQCGVLAESQGEVWFLLPLLQEYLAGRHIARHHAEDIHELFLREASRPWMHALSFALDHLPGKDAELRKLLDLAEDDAFATNLRAVAAAVAGGVEVTDELRALISARLLALMQNLSVGGGDYRIHELLADGFCNPPSDEVRHFLVTAKHFHDGEATMLVAARDDELTLSIMKRLLDSAPPLRWSRLKGAVDRVRSEVSQLVLDRARTPHPPRVHSRDIPWMASLLATLGPPLDDADPRVRAAYDSSLPPIIRIGCHVAARSCGLAEVSELVHSALLAFYANETAGMSDPLLMLFDALWLAPTGREIWASILDQIDNIPLGTQPNTWWLFKAAPADRYWEELVQSIVGRAPACVARDALAAVAEHALSPERRDYLDVVRAAVGDEEAAVSIATRVGSMRARTQRLWVLVASKGERKTFETGLRQLAVGPPDQDGGASVLAFALRFDVDFSFNGSASGRARRLHPSTALGIAALKQWASREPNAARRASLLADCVDLGDRTVVRELRDLIEAYLDASTSSNHQTDTGYSHAMTALGSVGACSVELLKRAALHPLQSNLAIRAVRVLRELLSDRALLTLVEVHNAVPVNNRRHVEREIEGLAAVLGRRIVRDENGTLRIRPSR